MNIKEFKNKKITPQISYVIGLCYPLYKEITVNNQRFVVGAVNHNPNLVDDTQLASHFKSIRTLINAESQNLLLMSNQNSTCNITSKKGFSLLLNIFNYTREEVENIFFLKIREILDIQDLLLMEWFVRGCFDGRSSWDTTLKCLAVDVDRNYEKQDLIKKVINKFSLNVNLNRRRVDHEKNDQIRIKRDSVPLYLKKIGFLSLARKRIVEYAIEHEWSLNGYSVR